MRDRRTKTLTWLAGSSVLVGGLVWLGLQQQKHRRLSETAAQYERTRARCVDEVRVVSDEGTTKHGKVAALLARLDRSYLADLYWNEGLEAEQRAMGTRSKLDIVVRRVGPVRDVSSHAVYPPGSLDMAGLLCAERMEVDAQVELRSADGLLNERFLAPITLNGTNAELFEELPLTALRGSFAITRIVRENMRVSRLRLSLRFEPSGAIGGHIGAQGLVDDGGGQYARLVRFACFPAEACP